MRVLDLRQAIDGIRGKDVTGVQTCALPIYQEGSALHSFGRLVHLTEGSHYQWSRGWLEAKEPYRNDLIETIDLRLGRFVPFGSCYLDRKSVA